MVGRTCGEPGSGTGGGADYILAKSHSKITKGDGLCFTYPRFPTGRPEVPGPSGQNGDGSGEALDGSLTATGDEVMNAATAACSGPVETELYYFLEHFGGMAEEMVGRAGSAMEGCALAVDAYLVGPWLRRLRATQATSTPSTR